MLMKSSGSTPPRDGRLHLTEERRLDQGLKVFMWVVAGAGIVYALILLSLNITCRKRRVIKLSSPTFNNVVGAGSVLCFLAVILYGVDTGTVHDPSLLGHICMGRAWVLSTGFTLAFGGLFVKTWRVYMIFSSTGKKQVAIKDSHLLALLVSGLTIDVAVMLPWTLLDPMHVERKDLPPEINEEADLAVYPFVRECNSATTYTYIGVVYLYKGLLLLYGAFLAYETRKVKIAHLNDSKLIGVAIYNVFILCAIGAPLVAFIQNQQDLIYILVGVFVTLGTTLVLSLVFLPKVIQLRKSDDQIHVSTMTSVVTASTAPNADTFNQTINSLKEKVASVEAKNKQLTDDACLLTKELLKHTAFNSPQISEIINKYNVMPAN